MVRVLTGNLKQRRRSYFRHSELAKNLMRTSVSRHYHQILPGARVPLGRSRTQNDKGFFEQLYLQPAPLINKGLGQIPRKLEMTEAFFSVIS